MKSNDAVDDGVTEVRRPAAEEEQGSGSADQLLQELAYQSRKLEHIESRLGNLEEMTEDLEDRTTVVVEWVNRKIGKKERKRLAKLEKKKKE